MKKIIWLLILWMAIDTFTIGYLIKTEKAFLHFADMMVDDNLKNVIVSEGKTFLIAQMVQVDINRPDLPIQLFGPVYMDADEMDKISNWKRNMSIMVRDFERMDLESRIQMAKVNTWFKSKLAETQEREEKKK